MLHILGLIVLVSQVLLAAGATAYLWRVGKNNPARPHWQLPVHAPKTLKADFTFRGHDLGVL